MKIKFAIGLILLFALLFMLPKATLKFRALAGNDKAQFELGKKYFDDKSFIKAEYWFDKAREGGNIYAPFYMGQIYYYGYEIPSDHKKALALFIESAKRGLIEGEYNAGLLMLRGDGVEPRPDLALPILEDAANHGYSDAAILLGRYWLNSKGDKANNYKKAIYWFNKDINSSKHITASYYFASLIHSDHDGNYYDPELAKKYMELVRSRLKVGIKQGDSSAQQAWVVAEQTLASIDRKVVQ